MGLSFLSIQTEFNKGEEDNTFQDLYNSSNHTKDEPNNFFVIHQKFVILKPVVFVLFLICFKALFWLFPLRITREIHCFFELCSLHFCFPSFFDIVLLSTSGFQIWSTVANFLCRIRREISTNQKLRNVLHELRTRT